MTQRFHCTAVEGRQILGEFYVFGDPIDFEDDQLDLAFAHQKAKLVSPGDFVPSSSTGKISIENGSEESEQEADEPKPTRKKKGPQ